MMDLRVYESADEAATAAARWLETALSAAVSARGVASLALSGGRTPWRMLDALAPSNVPWRAMRVYQVDERAVAPDDERRNGARIVELLVKPDRLNLDQFMPMSAESDSLSAAADAYAKLLVDQLGNPPMIDIVQLGLGGDAHTASLIPNDPLLDVDDRWVGVSSVYQGTQRLSLTFPALNAARSRLWLVTGADKTESLAALMTGDTRLPCGRVKREDSVIFADAAAAARVRP